MARGVKIVAIATLVIIVVAHVFMFVGCKATKTNPSNSDFYKMDYQK